MTSRTSRRLIRLEDQVAGLGPGCRVCRPLGDTQITDDHGLTRQRLQQRIKRVAISLRYDPPDHRQASDGWRPSTLT